MKISVICLAPRSGGGLKILKELYAFASDVDSKNQWQFVLSDQSLGRSTSRVEVTNVAPEYKGWSSRVLAEFTGGRRAVSQFDPDIVLSLQNIDTPARGKRPLAIYLHQALPFQTDYRLSFFKRTERRLAWRQYILKWPIILSVRKSAVTFVQTRWLAESLLTSTPASQVISIGFNQSAKEAQLSSHEYHPQYFFYPASGAPYKNHRTLHLALKVLNERGIDLTDKVSVTLTAEQIKAATGLSTDRELLWYRKLGWLTSEKVTEEYSRSILVFPSLVESLGLPLYEARAMKVRIVAADTAFGREALDGYPLVTWFDATNPVSLANALQSSIGSPETSRTSPEGKAEACDSWQKMLKALEAVCDGL